MTEAESNKVIAEYVELQKLMAVARRRMMDGDVPISVEIRGAGVTG